MFIMVLMFSFSKFCHSYNFRQIWAKSNVLHIDWNLIQGHLKKESYNCCLLITFLMCNLSKYLPSWNFGENFIPKSVVLHIYWNLAYRYDIISSTWENNMKQNLPKIFWTKHFWKIISFDYNQHIILIMYTNARLRQSDFVQNYMNDQFFEKIMIKIVISI